MLRKRSVFAGIGVALTAVLSVPVALVMAVPASAVSTCTSGINPKVPGGQSGLRVACLLDVSATASLNVNRLEVHDALDAVWHRGAARTVTVTTFASPSTTITFAAGQLGQGDLRRPISGTGVAGGAFITTVLPAACTVACTSATVSKAGTAAAAHAVKVEHTTARTLQDATVTTGAASNLSSATAKFVLADVGKSVSGGAFSAGSKITGFVSALAVTVAPVATAASALDTITIGGTQYAGAVPTYTETWHRQIAKTTGATCALSVLTSLAAGGGFRATDVGLKVQFMLIGVPGLATKITLQTATTATLAAPCPAAAAWDRVVIGEAGANAPTNGDVMFAMGTTLNLNPVLVATGDDCNKNTYEGFSTIGKYFNPGSYLTAAVLGAPLDMSSAQIAIPTSVLTFAAYLTPVATDALQLGQHYDFIFPSLPTSLAVCTPGLGVPPTSTVKTGISLGFTSTTATASPSLPTGSGNPSAPGLRNIGPQIGSFVQKMRLMNGVTVLVAPVGTPCLTAASTTAPTYSCGDG